MNDGRSQTPNHSERGGDANVVVVEIKKRGVHRSAHHVH